MGVKGWNVALFDSDGERGLLPPLNYCGEGSPLARPILAPCCHASGPATVPLTSSPEPGGLDRRQHLLRLIAAGPEGRTYICVDIYKSVNMV